MRSLPKTPWATSSMQGTVRQLNYCETCCQVDCKIGANGALSCANKAGITFSCSGPAPAGGNTGYICRGQEGARAHTYGCDIIASQPGAFTLFCTRLLQ